MAPVQHAELDYLMKSSKSGGGFDGKLSVRLHMPSSKYIWTGSMILSWYVLGTILGITNKLLVGADQGLFGKGAFPAPLLLTGVQFACQALLARAVFGTGLMRRTAPVLSWGEWGTMVLPNGSITGLDIGLSNKSLVHITMSFYTMCKSTTPIFLLLFAFVMRVERPSCSLLGIVCVIVAGLLLMVEGEAHFNATGFALVMTAACMSGLRFTLTQVLLHARSTHGKSPFGGPLEVLEVLTPVMAATTLTLSLVLEGLWSVLPGSPYFDGWRHSAVTGGVVLAGAVVAFLMVWAEYEVIKDTSALTFMVAGIFKEIVTILAAVAVFKDRFGWMNGLGVGVAIAGVCLFNMYKIRRMQEADVAQDVLLVARHLAPGAPSDRAERGAALIGAG